MGALVRRIDGEPSLLSRAGLLPLATRQSELARCLDSDSRRQRSGDGVRERTPGAPGTAHLRHGTPRRGGPGTDLRDSAAAVAEPAPEAGRLGSLASNSRMGTRSYPSQSYF